VTKHDAKRPPETGGLEVKKARREHPAVST
jgi:hypothetical protein